MDYFNYKNGQLYAEDAPLIEIAATFGTPCYIYSRATLERHWHAFNDALAEREHLICYAVKANSNLAVLNILSRLGSGFDIVSLGELERVLRAGGDPAKVVFSGVGKRPDEIRRALEVGIHCFNVESAWELQQLDYIARTLHKRAPVSIRVNPDVDPKTHPYISTGLKENKFGIDFREALLVYEKAASLKHIDIIGIDCHIGSQLIDLAPFLDSLERLLSLAEILHQRGIVLQHLDLGGGLGIRYADELPPLPGALAKAINMRLGNCAYKILLEPGRAIVGNAGILLTRVEHNKMSAHKNFAIVDAAMNDLIRPALYGAWQAVVPVIEHTDAESRLYDIVGPVCETGDFIAKDRQLKLKAGDLLAVRSAGAYGFSMSSNYNTRPRVAELMVDGDAVHLVRQRETLDDLMRGESLLPG